MEAVAAAGERPGLLERFLRPGCDSSADVRTDILWLLGLGLLLIASGLGFRDPWPADEPRFALIAQDMLRSGDWLIPRVGGDLYADKPPLFFWAIALATAVTGSLRVGFLLPSLLAGLGTVLLVYDLARRLHGREAAVAAGLVLLCTFQFVWQPRQAQIDATLCFLTTLSLYGLLRHVLLGPALRWFLAGWAAAGLGVITKGVGFLPLLVLLPLAVLVKRGWPATVSSLGRASLLGLAATLAAIGLWFVPMLIHTAASPELLAYRNEILFQQTVTRYADAWHHHEPFWYYFVRVIPILWLPLIALVPWLWPRWRDALRSRQTATAALLAWVVIVVLFFSFSSGKRGVYVLPAVPALVMAAAPWLPELLRARGPRRLAFGLALALSVAACAAAAYFGIDGEARQKIVGQFGADPVLPLLLAGAGGLAIVSVFRLRDAWLGFAGVLAVTLLVVGFVVNPAIDEVRSGRALMAKLEQASVGDPELGLVGAKEQYLLELRRPSVNFGHARWRERENEAADAAAWMAQGTDRALFVDGKVRALCFATAEAEEIGKANRQTWFVVRGMPDPACVTRGNLARAISYAPPEKWNLGQ